MFADVLCNIRPDKTYGMGAGLNKQQQRCDCVAVVDLELAIGALIRFGSNTGVNMIMLKK